MGRGQREVDEDRSSTSAQDEQSEHYRAGVDNETDTTRWSYYTLTIKNPSVPLLQSKLAELGADGWELVTSVTTVKTWLNMTGNELVFVFKKPGLGHIAKNLSPTIDQQTFLVQLLKERGFDAGEIERVNGTLRERGLWSPDAFFDVSTRWQLLRPCRYRSVVDHAG